MPGQRAVAFSVATFRCLLHLLFLVQLSVTFVTLLSVLDRSTVSASERNLPMTIRHLNGAVCVLHTPFRFRDGRLPPCLPRPPRPIRAFPSRLNNRRRIHILQSLAPSNGFTSGSVNLHQPRAKKLDQLKYNIDRCHESLRSHVCGRNRKLGQIHRERILNDFVKGSWWVLLTASSLAKSTTR